MNDTSKRKMKLVFAQYRYFTRKAADPKEESLSRVCVERLKRKRQMQAGQIRKKFTEDRPSVVATKPLGIRQSAWR